MLLLPPLAGRDSPSAPESAAHIGRLFAPLAFSEPERFFAGQALVSSFHAPCVSRFFLILDFFLFWQFRREPAALLHRLLPIIAEPDQALWISWLFPHSFRSALWL